MAPLIYIKNHETGEETTREMTPEEQAELKPDGWTVESENSNK
jgi:hypothetical protein